MNERAFRPWGVVTLARKQFGTVRVIRSSANQFGTEVATKVAGPAACLLEICGNSNQRAK